MKDKQVINKESLRRIADMLVALYELDEKLHGEKGKEIQ